MQSFPTLRTERLLLNQPQHTDIPSIVEYANHEAISAMTLNIPYPYQAEDAVFWLNMSIEGFRQQNRYVFAIRDRETEAFMGGIGMSINTQHNRGTLGYWMGVPFWSRGFMTEAAAAVLQFGFETLQLNRIEATHLVGNPASGQVMLKNGMIYEGELRDLYRKGEVYRTVKQYRLTRAEYDGQIN
ncbi:MAG: GNAT family protein [Bacteroidota bacterium]